MPARVDSIFDDPRVLNLWDDDRVLGQWHGQRDELNAGRFGPIVWDAFFIFERDSEWRATPSVLLGSGAPVIGETSKLDSAVAKPLEPA